MLVSGTKYLVSIFSSDDIEKILMTSEYSYLPGRNSGISIKDATLTQASTVRKKEKKRRKEGHKQKKEMMLCYAHSFTTFQC